MTTTNLATRSTDVYPTNPLDWEIGRLSRGMERLFDDLLGPTLPLRRFQFPEEWEATTFAPRCDMEDRENAVVLTAEVPGYGREELSVEARGDTLTLRGEHHQERTEDDTRYVCRESCRGTFERTFRLPGEIDVEHVEAKLKDGILTLTLPKLHAEEHRRIEVTEG